jgi:hypothetical protein
MIDTILQTAFHLRCKIGFQIIFLVTLPAGLEGVFPNKQKIRRIFELGAAILRVK